ncbi:MAG: hypothetical protein AB7D51_11580 [Desulfovibrionaceae bacterium]
MRRSTPAAVFRKLAALYGRMAEAYAAHAADVGLSCEGCQDNCCLSYFQHHTHVEWAYLMKGMAGLDEPTRGRYVRRAEEYVARARRELAGGASPRIMCPLNDDGRCGMYEHRLMICRLHGVPNVIVQPSGRAVKFAGCWRTQELTSGMDNPPLLDRTKLYTDLVKLEMEFVGPKLRSLPRVDLTLAEMIVLGPPQLG